MAFLACAACAECAHDEHQTSSHLPKGFTKNSESFAISLPFLRKPAPKMRKMSLKSHIGVVLVNGTMVALKLIALTHHRRLKCL